MIRLPNRQIRQRWPDEVYSSAEDALSSGPTAPSSADIARQLEQQFGEGTPTPGERVIRDWIRKGVIRRREDAWTAFDRDTAPEDLPLVLQSLAAWIEADRGGVQLYTAHAYWIVRLRRAFPDLAPLDAADMAEEFARVDGGRGREGWHAAGLTRYLAFRGDDARYRESALRRFPEYYQLRQDMRTWKASRGDKP